MAQFAPIGARFGMDWQMRDVAVKPRVLIMVSKFDHCLNDLLYRYKLGWLPMHPVAIVSNHRDAYGLAASYDVPFFTCRSRRRPRRNRRPSCGR